MSKVQVILMSLVVYVLCTSYALSAPNSTLRPLMQFSEELAEPLRAEDSRFIEQYPEFKLFLMDHRVVGLRRLLNAAGDRVSIRYYSPDDEGEWIELAFVSADIAESYSFTVTWRDSTEKLAWSSKTSHADQRKKLIQEAFDYIIGGPSLQMWKQRARELRSRYALSAGNKKFINKYPEFKPFLTSTKVTGLKRILNADGDVVIITYYNPENEEEWIKLELVRTDRAEMFSFTATWRDSTGKLFWRTKTSDSSRMNELIWEAFEQMFGAPSLQVWGQRAKEKLMLNLPSRAALNTGTKL